MKLTNRNPNKTCTKTAIQYGYASLGNWWPFKTRPFPYDNIYLHMFLEDVKTTLFPYSNNTKMCITTASELDEKIVSYALAGESQDIRMSLWSCIDKGLIYNLLMYGKAHYEIVYDNNDFKFNLIPEYSLLTLAGKMYQYIPKEISLSENLPRFLRLPKKNIFCISLSKALRYKTKKLLKSLLYLGDKGNMPLFAKDALMKNILIPQYDYTWYNKKSKGILAKAAKDIGWNGRNIFNAEMLEYYTLIMFLRFEKFKYEFRNIIIDGINDGLSKAVSSDNKPKLILQDFPTEIEITEAMRFLTNGEKKFNDIVSPFVT